jgi:prepilin-type N-terminal cleavage/methylation domain-containing protein
MQVTARLVRPERKAGARTRRGFTLVEVVIALAVVTIALIAMYMMVSRSLLLSRVNRQTKIALFHAQTIVEQIMGAPFDQIMDPDYPILSEPQPRFRHLQEVRPLIAIFGFEVDTGGNPIIDIETLEPQPRGLPADRHKITEFEAINGARIEVQRYVVDSEPTGTLPDECITVTYGTQLDTADLDGDGDTAEVLPLAIVANSHNQTNYIPTGGAPNERFRPLDNAGGSFVTPDPLYFTVKVSWEGEQGHRMWRQITAVRTR